EANYRAGTVEQAAPIFERVAAQRPELASDALFNAALCWLRLDHGDQFANDFRRVANDPGPGRGRGDCCAEKGHSRPRRENRKRSRPSRGSSTIFLRVRESQKRGSPWRSWRFINPGPILKSRTKIWRSLARTIQHLRRQSAPIICKFGWQIRLR